MNVGPPPPRARSTASARRLVDREHVAAVDAHARHPVADGLVGERLGAGLRRERRRDRPLVVVAEEDQRRLHHRREVGALVEGALARRAVAEVGDRDGRVALQLLAPREPGGVRDVRRDRDADRGDAVLRRVPPAGGMAAPPVEDGARRDARAAARSPTRGSSERSSPRRRARAPSRPASPRGSRRSRTSRSGPGGDRRPSARRTCAAGSASGRSRGARRGRGRRPRAPRRARASARARRHDLRHGREAYPWRPAKLVVLCCDEHRDGLGLRAVRAEACGALGQRRARAARARARGVAPRPRHLGVHGALGAACRAGQARRRGADRADQPLLLRPDRHRRALRRRRAQVPRRRAPAVLRRRRPRAARRAAPRSRCRRSSRTGGGGESSVGPVAARDGRRGSSPARATSSCSAATSASSSSAARPHRRRSSSRTRPSRARCSPRRAPPRRSRDSSAAERGRRPLGPTRETRAPADLPTRPDEIRPAGTFPTSSRRAARADRGVRGRGRASPRDGRVRQVLRHRHARRAISTRPRTALGELADVVSAETRGASRSPGSSRTSTATAASSISSPARLRASGDDEERMLRAVRAIVDAHAGPPISVGVNRGHGSRRRRSAPTTRRTYAVMGDTVNLAARL